MRAWILVLAACRGGSQPALVDGNSVDGAPAGDAMVDAPPVAGDCAEDLAGVAVEPAGFVELVVHEATGAPLCRQSLGQTTAHVAVPAGGALTLIAEFDDTDYLSLLGLQPGDVVAPQLPALNDQFPIEVSFTDFPGATSYRLTCANQASATSPLDATMDDRCRGGDGKLHVLLTARSSTNAVIAYTELGPFDAVPATITAPAFQSTFVSTTINATNTPSDLASEVRSCAGIVLGGVLIPSGCGASSAVQATFLLPAIGDAIYAHTAFESGESGTWIASKQVSPGTTSITIDADTDALPRVISVTESGAVGRPKLSWTTSRPVTAGVELVAGFDWEGNNSTKQWYVVGPITTSSPLLFPLLPADLQPGPIQDRSLFLFDNDEIDFARVRTHPYDVWRLPIALAVGDMPARWGMSVLGDYDPK